MAQFAVIGLGSFGATIATQLVSLNHDVIGIDSNKKFVESISDQITHAVIADATDSSNEAAKRSNQRAMRREYDPRSNAFLTAIT